MKGTNKPVTVRTAQNHIKQIKEFFRWLHKNSDYEWRKPDDFDDLVVSVKSNLREKAAKVSPVAVDTYRLDELCVLYKYATPLERLFFLLGLNCGFGQAEIATVLVKEAELFKAALARDVAGLREHGEGLFHPQDPPEDGGVRRVAALARDR